MIKKVLCLSIQFSFLHSLLSSLIAFLAIEDSSTKKIIRWKLLRILKSRENWHTLSIIQKVVVLRNLIHFSDRDTQTKNWHFSFFKSCFVLTILIANTNFVKEPLNFMDLLNLFI